LGGGASPCFFRHNKPLSVSLLLFQGVSKVVLTSIVSILTSIISVLTSIISFLIDSSL
jgi:hypothetical protein